MRLTRFLLSYRPEFHGFIPKFKGKVEIGKDRFVPPITARVKLAYLRKAIWEVEVMKHLEKPYLTEAQESAYLQSVGRTVPELHDDYLQREVVEPPKQQYAADFIAPLDVSRKFEEED